MVRTVNLQEQLYKKAGAKMTSCCASCCSRLRRGNDPHGPHESRGNMAKVVIWHKETRLEASVPNGLHVLMGGFQVGLDQYGFGDCGGNLICASCHVRVKSGTFSPMKLDEQYRLEELPQIFADSRLACQLKVTGDCEVEWVG